jgi:UPF0755 protein
LKSILSYIREGRKYIITLLILLVVSYAAMAWLIFPTGTDKTPIIVLVQKGDGAFAVGRTLKTNGLVHSPLGFAFVARITGKASGIHPGAYRFNRAMPVPTLLNMLFKGDVAADWVTVPEGFTAKQIAERLSARKLVDKNSFLSMVNTGAAAFSNTVNVPSGSLEGYLFPDTYHIMVNSSPREIIEQMLKDFQRNVVKKTGVKIDGVDEAAKAKNLYRAIIIASMIESEARIPKDRPLISAVIQNRLQKGMKLDIDATIEYALGRHKQKITYADLQVDSPYNTYKNPGLPAGPICSPGIESIKAALHPANVDYLYYVAKPDGSHVFSHTLAEHNAAKQRIRGGT